MSKLEATDRLRSEGRCHLLDIMGFRCRNFYGLNARVINGSPGATKVEARYAAYKCPGERKYCLKMLRLPDSEDDDDSDREPYEYQC